MKFKVFENDVLVGEEEGEELLLEEEETGDSVSISVKRGVVMVKLRQQGSNTWKRKKKKNVVTFEAKD